MKTVDKTKLYCHNLPNFLPCILFLQFYGVHPRDFSNFTRSSRQTFIAWEDRISGKNRNSSLFPPPENFGCRFEETSDFTPTGNYYTINHVGVALISSFFKEATSKCTWTNSARNPICKVLFAFLGNFLQGQKKIDAAFY